VRREVDALEETGLSGHVHRQAFFGGGYHELPLRNIRFRVASDEPVLLSAAVFRGTEMRSAVTMVEAKQRSHSSKLSALCITSRSVILHPFGCGQLSGARKIRDLAVQGRSELSSSHDD
jgi:hypothetical protein